MGSRFDLVARGQDRYFDASWGFGHARQVWSRRQECIGMPGSESVLATLQTDPYSRLISETSKSGKQRNCTCAAISGLFLCRVVCLSFFLCCFHFLRQLTAFANKLCFSSRSSFSPLPLSSSSTPQRFPFTHKASLLPSFFIFLVRDSQSLST